MIIGTPNIAYNKKNKVAAMRRCNFRGQASKNDKFIFRASLFNFAI